MEFTSPTDESDDSSRSAGAGVQEDKGATDKDAKAGVAGDLEVSSNTHFQSNLTPADSGPAQCFLFRREIAFECVIPFIPLKPPFAFSFLQSGHSGPAEPSAPVPPSTAEGDRDAERSRRRALLFHGVSVLVSSVIISIGIYHCMQEKGWDVKRRHIPAIWLWFIVAGLSEPGPKCAVTALHRGFVRGWRTAFHFYRPVPVDP